MKKIIEHKHFYAVCGFILFLFISFAFLKNTSLFWSDEDRLYAALVQCIDYEMAQDDALMNEPQLSSQRLEASIAESYDRCTTEKNAMIAHFMHQAGEKTETNNSRITNLDNRLREQTIGLMMPVYQSAIDEAESLINQ